MTERTDLSRSTGTPWLLRSLSSLGVLVLVATVVGRLLIDAEASFGPLWIDRAAAGMPSLHAPVPNFVATAVTGLGEEIALLTVFVYLASWAWLARGPVWGRYFAVVGVGALALDNIVKPLVGRDRPGFEQLVPGTGFSFPSGHVIGMTALLFAVTYLIGGERSGPGRRVVWTFVAAGTLIVAASRIYLGVHWPSDVVAGMWLGSVWAWRCHRSLISNTVMEIGRLKTYEVIADES